MKFQDISIELDNDFQITILRGFLEDNQSFLVS